MVATLQNHSGIHITTTGLNALKPRHRLPKLPSKVPFRPLLGHKAAMFVTLRNRSGNSHSALS